MIVPMVLSKTALLRLTTNDCSYGTFKDYPPTIYDKRLFLWYFQRLPSYDLRQMIVPMVLSKTARLRLTTHDCSYGTLKDCPPTIDDKCCSYGTFKVCPPTTTDCIFGIFTLLLVKLVDLESEDMHRWT